MNVRPVSRDQEILYFGDVKRTIALQFRERVDRRALAKAVGELARRHELLRSTFHLEGGRVLRVVDDDAAPDVCYEDRRADEDGGWAGVRAALAAHRQPFDLSAEPPCRLTLIDTDDRSVLVVTHHHIIYDAVALTVFASELHVFYSSAKGGVPTAPLPPPGAFEDYVQEERACLEGASGEAAGEAAADLVRGAPFITGLPLGDPGADAEVSTWLGFREGLLDGVERRVRELRATPFTVLLAAFNALVARYTGDPDPRVATIVGNRSARFSHTLGPFTRIVPVRVHLGGDPTFAEVVVRTRAALLAVLDPKRWAGRLEAVALQREACPYAAVAHFDLVVQALPARGGGTPTEVGLEYVPMELLEPPPEEGAPAPPQAEEAGEGFACGLYRRWLHLTITLGADAGCAAIGTFDPAALSSLWEAFESLLAAGVARPTTRLSELPPAACAALPVLSDELADAALPAPRRLATIVRVLSEMSTGARARCLVAPAAAAAEMAAVLDACRRSGVSVERVDEAAWHDPAALLRALDEADADGIVAPPAWMGGSVDVAPSRRERLLAFVVGHGLLSPSEWDALRAAAGLHAWWLWLPGTSAAPPLVGRITGGPHRPSFTHVGGRAAVDVVHGDGSPTPTGAVGTLLLDGVQGPRALRVSPEPSGELRVVGRQDEHVRFRGLEVDVRRIERAYERHASVRKALVVLERDARSDVDDLVAYIEVAAEPPSPTALFWLVWELWPGHPVPAHVHVVDRLPLDADGCVLRRAPGGPRRLLTWVQRDPETAVERLLCEAWAEATGKGPVDPDMHTFLLAGNQVPIWLAFLRAAHARSVEPTWDDIGAYPTPALLAAALDGRRSAKTPRRAGAS